MKEKNLKHCFELFVQEIRGLKNPSFINLEDWALGDDLQNGVIVGYSIKDKYDRELLHSIGKKYGLIPLCPGEVVDIDVSSEQKIMRSFVRSIFGKLQVSP